MCSFKCRLTSTACAAAPPSRYRGLLVLVASGVSAVTREASQETVIEGAQTPAVEEVGFATMTRVEKGDETGDETRAAFERLVISDFARCPVVYPKDLRPPKFLEKAASLWRVAQKENPASPLTKQVCFELLNEVTAAMVDCNLDDRIPELHLARQYLINRLKAGDLPGRDVVDCRWAQAKNMLIWNPSHFQKREYKVPSLEVHEVLAATSTFRHEMWSINHWLQRLPDECCRLCRKHAKGLLRRLEKVLHRLLEVESFTVNEAWGREFYFLQNGLVYFLWIEMHLLSHLQNVPIETVLKFRQKLEEMLVYLDAVFKPLGISPLKAADAAIMAINHAYLVRPEDKGLSYCAWPGGFTEDFMTHLWRLLDSHSRGGSSSNCSSSSSNCSSSGSGGSSSSEGSAISRKASSSSANFLSAVTESTSASSATKAASVATQQKEDGVVGDVRYSISLRERKYRSALSWQQKRKTTSRRTRQQKRKTTSRRTRH